MLCSQPNEILLQILRHVSNENHVDLIPLASTCRRMRALVADWTIWAGPVTIAIDPSSSYCAQDLYLPMAAAIYPPLPSPPPARATHVNLVIENKDSCQNIGGLLHCVLRGTSDHMKSLVLYTPASTHAAIIRDALQPGASAIGNRNPRAYIESVTLRDPSWSMLDQHPEPLASSCQHALMQWLAQSRASLAKIDIPSCPLHWFTQYDHAIVFDMLESLTVTLDDSGQQATNITTDDDGGSFLNARRLKQTFPRLKALTVHLPCADRFSLLLPLLTDRELYPWIETITVSCPDDDRLRNRLPQQEMAALLMSLKGVSRINAGWDMVALAQI